MQIRNVRYYYYNTALESGSNAGARTGNDFQNPFHSWTIVSRLKYALRRAPIVGGTWTQENSEFRRAVGAAYGGGKVRTNYR